MATIALTIPTDHSAESRQLWKKLRLADALHPEHDSGDPIEIGNFDCGTLVQ